MGYQERTDAIRQLRLGRELANVENIGKRAMRGLRVKTEAELRDYIRDSGEFRAPPDSMPLHALAGMLALLRRAAASQVTMVGKLSAEASCEKEAEAIQRLQLTDMFAEGRPWMHMLRIAGTNTYNLLLPVSVAHTQDTARSIACLSVDDVLEMPCRALVLPVRNRYWTCVLMLDLEDGIAAYARMPAKNAKCEDEGA